MYVVTGDPIVILIVDEYNIINYIYLRWNNIIKHFTTNDEIPWASSEETLCDYDLI